MEAKQQRQLSAIVGKEGHHKSGEGNDHGQTQLSELRGSGLSGRASSTVDMPIIHANSTSFNPDLTSTTEATLTAAVTPDTALGGRNSADDLEVANRKSVGSTVSSSKRDSGASNGAIHEGYLTKLGPPGQDKMGIDQSAFVVAAEEGRRRMRRENFVAFKVCS